MSEEPGNQRREGDEKFPWKNGLKDSEVPAAAYAEVERLIQAALNSSDEVLKLDFSNFELVTLPPTLPEDLSKLQNLSTLDLRGNQLAELPQDFSNLQNLSTLNLSRNQLAELPQDFSKLQNLSELFLSSNQLAELPLDFSNLQNLSTLNLSRNPLPDDLLAAAGRGVQELFAYLAQSKSVQWEGKVILIGEGQVGKTKLLRALCGERLNKPDITHGLERHDLKLDHPDGEMEINCHGWDFGGQVSYRPTQQLFFSASAIYLVVWNPRIDGTREKLRSWMDQVRSSVGENVRFLIVGTCADIEYLPRSLPQKEELIEIFGNCLREDDFYDVGLPDADKGSPSGVDALKQAIAQRATHDKRFFRQEVRDDWLPLRNAAEDTDRTHYSWKEFQKLAEDYCFEGETEIRNFCEHHDRLGLLIYQPTETSVKDLVITRPEWLTWAIHRIATNEFVLEQGGLIDRQLFSAILGEYEPEPGVRYPVETHGALLKLMEGCLVCYPVTETENDDQLWLFSLSVNRKKPEDLATIWPESVPEGLIQDVAIYQFSTERDDGNPNEYFLDLELKGVIYKLIVLLHKFSLGWESGDPTLNRHWNRGLVIRTPDGVGNALIQLKETRASSGQEMMTDLWITARGIKPGEVIGAVKDDIQNLLADLLGCTVPKRQAWCGAHCKDEKMRQLGQFDWSEIQEERSLGNQVATCQACRKPLKIDDLLSTPEYGLAIGEGQKRQLREIFREDFSEVKDLIHLEGQASEIRDRKIHERVGEVNVGIFRLLKGVDRIESKVDMIATYLNDASVDAPRLMKVRETGRGLIFVKFQAVLLCEHSGTAPFVLDRLEKGVLQREQDGTLAGVYAFKIPRWWLRWFRKGVYALMSLAHPAIAVAGTIDAGINQLYNQSELGWVLAKESKAPNEQAAMSLLCAEGKREGGELRRIHNALKKAGVDIDSDGRGGLTRVMIAGTGKVRWVHRRFANLTVYGGTETEVEPATPKVAIQKASSTRPDDAADA